MRIDTDVPFDAAALIGCGVTTGMGAVLNTARVTPGSTVAVYGAGGVGLSAMQGARIAGARMIIAVDVEEHKLRTARDLAATHGIDASAGDPVEQIRDLTGGQGVDFFIRGDRAQAHAATSLRLDPKRRHDDGDRGDRAG